MTYPDGWQLVSFGAVAEVIHGWPFRSAEYEEARAGSPIVLSIGSFNYKGGFRFDSTTRKGYSGTYPSEFELAPGDLVLVMTCQTPGGEILGVPGIIPSDGRLYLHNQRIGKVNLRSDATSADYLFQVARTSAFNSQLCKSASGSKILHTAPSRIESCLIPLPPLPEQRAIAEVLGALDDKIATNAALTSLADELAAVRFQAATAGGGEPKALSSLAQFINGKAFTRDATGTGRVVIRIAELNSGLGGSTVYNDLEVAAHHLARPGDLLFAWSGSLTVKRWFRDEGIVNQHIFKVIPTAVPLWVVNGALRAKLSEFKGVAADKATTMGHIQRHHLDEPVVVPAADVIIREDAAMQALWDRALQAERESLTLDELRDALLPELISGRLRVKDAESVVQGVI